MMAAITKELYSFLISLSNTKEEIRINVYYDNGQVEITKIMNSVFSLMPYEYALYLKTSNSSSKLFQIADLVSTLKLYEVKMINHELSKSELAFIDSRNFKKVYLKSIERKKLNI